MQWNSKYETLTTTVYLSCYLGDIIVFSTSSSFWIYSVADKETVQIQTHNLTIEFFHIIMQERDSNEETTNWYRLKSIISKRMGPC